MHWLCTSIFFRVVGETYPDVDVYLDEDFEDIFSDPGNISSELLINEATRRYAIVHTITHGVNSELIDPASRNAVMPAFGSLGKGLSDGTIKKLAIYVHQLGGENN